MSAFAYYNEIDERAVAWLNELIKRGVIADGVVDARPFSATSSPASAYGATRCASRGGQTIALCGPAPVPVNPSV